MFERKILDLDAAIESYREILTNLVAKKEFDL